ncbi:MAG: PqqD family protein [Polyangiaceae bacterium]
MSSADLRFVVAGDIHVRTFDGDLVILDLDRGDYFGVNEVGARLWTGLVAGRTPREVALELGEEFDVDASTLLEDLVSLTQDFLARGLVRPRDDTT